MCWSSGMASNPTRRVSCLSRSLSLVCKIPMSFLGLLETNTIGYYAITDNSESCQRYRHLTRRALFKWLNRRSQRKSYTWDGFLQALRHVGWPQVRVRLNLNPFATLNG